jgi:hypothetical protein
VAIKKTAGYTPGTARSGVKGKFNRLSSYNGRAGKSNNFRRLVANVQAVNPVGIAAHVYYNKKFKGQGYSASQIKTARIAAKKRGTGTGRMIAGAALAGVGGNVLRNSQSGRGKLIGAAIGAAGVGLVVAGNRAKNAHVKSLLSGVKPAGSPGAKPKARPGMARGATKQRARGMSRSQAASIAAKARWGRGRR